MTTAVRKLNTRAPLDRSPKKNEVERRGGLPMYIRRIANHLHAEKGMTISRAIAVAKNAAARMCASGDLNFPGAQQVNPASRAEACAAVADWNARIKGSRVSKHKGIISKAERERDYINHLIRTNTHGIKKKGFDPKQPRNPETGEWIDTEGLKFAHNLANMMFYSTLEKDPRPKRRKQPKVTKNPDGSVTVVMGKRALKITAEQRAKYKKQGVTDPHGGFPLPDADHVRRAVQAIGRAKNPELEKKRIIAAAKKFGCMHYIPASWNVSKGEYTEQIRTNAANRRLRNFHRGMDPSDERIKANLGSKKKKKRTVRREMSNKEFESLAKSLDADNPDAVDFELRGEVSKVDGEKQLVFGWASVSKLANGEVVVDKQGDVLDNLDDVERVAYDFVIESRDGGEMHVRKGVSTLVESFVSTPEKREKMGIPEGVIPDGWWVGFKVQNPQVWEAVKKGKYRMFSVHGTGMRKAMEDE